MPLLYVENDNGKLAVEVDGPEDGPLVILSPAMGDSREAYGPLADELVAAGYRVVRPDLRGHGDSTTTFSSYGDEATARDFVALLDKFCPESESGSGSGSGSGSRLAVLGGASMSAGAATIAAARRPQQVAGLLFFGGFLRNPDFGQGIQGAVISALVRFAMAVLFVRPWGPLVWRAYSATLWPGLGPQGTAARATTATALLTRPGYWPAFFSTTRTDHSVVAPTLAQPETRAIPALVVVGDADPDWPDPVKEAHWVASNFDHHEIVVAPGCGHAPMLESPSVVGPATLSFLNKIRKGNSFIKA